MRVMFSKSDEGRLCSWRAELPKHRRLQGSTMAARAAGTDLPHDLAQFVVEATLGLEEIDPRAEGRPARRYHRLTPDGLELARIALARASTPVRPAWLRPVGEEP
jgi:hypothetical protein